MKKFKEARVNGGSNCDSLKNPDRVFSRLYIRSLQLRGGTLTTQARATRGRISPGDERKCRGGCQAVETQHHILQRCAKTHDVRCARHNRIVRLVCKKLKRKEQSFSVEPIIPRARTHIKPDIIVHRTERLTIMDVTVVAGYRLHKSWDIKIKKYGGEESKEAMGAWSGSEVEVDHLPIVISSRGLIFGPTGRGLRRLGFTSTDIMDLALCTLQGSINTYDTYMRGT
ncbi:MAG: hypothetical protein ACRC8Q_05215 [Aeromonas sp.]